MTKSLKKAVKKPSFSRKAINALSKVVPSAKKSVIQDALRERYPDANPSEVREIERHLLKHIAQKIKERKQIAFISPTDKGVKLEVVRLIEEVDE